MNTSHTFKHIVPQGAARRLARSTWIALVLSTAATGAAVAQGTVAATATGTTAAVTAASPTKQSLQELYKGLLEEKGYRPSVTDMGNIVFKAEDRGYVIYIDEKDPKYFRLVLAFQPPAETSDEAFVKRLKALNDATRSIKIVKGYITDSGSTSFAVEEFQSEPGDALKQLQRMIRGLQSAYNRYQTALK